MPRRDIEFTASDGTILRGWFYNHPSQSGKAPCIILTHGVPLFTHIKADKCAVVHGSQRNESRLIRRVFH